MARNSVAGLHIDLSGLIFIGHGLARPECALAHASGAVLVPDWTDTGGVSVIYPDGRVWRVLARDHAFDLKPNGIALRDDGAVLIAHLGPETGGLFALHADGRVETVLDKIDGRALPPSNFPLPDTKGRIWLTVSTRKVPRAQGYRAGAGDGFIVLIEGALDGGDIRARIVADDLGYTNECQLTPDGKTLLVNETFDRKLTAFDVRADGSLVNRRMVAEFGMGTYPDGLALDVDGGIWVTSIVSNRVIRIAPDGTQGIVLEDCTPEHLAWTEDAYHSGTMGWPHLDTVAGQVLRNTSNLAFGGPDLHTAYLGCLLGDRLATFRSAHAGVPPVHWTTDISPLLAAGDEIAQADPQESTL